jgi:hypothetical protein
MDFAYLLKLEELFIEYTSAGQTFHISEEQKKWIKSSKLDYEVFRYDFDLTCRFIYLFASLEKRKYSLTHCILIKYVFNLSTFLKNRTSLKISPKSESLLVKATENLVSTLRIDFSSLPDSVSTNNFDAARIFIAYALVNIHEIVGVSKTALTNPAAYMFLRNEMNLQTCESILIIFVTKLDDFSETSKCLDETVGRKAFLKYTKEPRPEYKKSIYNRILLIFGLICGLLLIFIIIGTEFILGSYQ